MSQKPKIPIPSQIIGYQLTPLQKTCTEDSALIYALGIGMSQDPLKQWDYQFTNQMHQSYKVFPSFVTCLHGMDILSPLMNCPGMPQFNPLMILYAEQRIQIFNKIKVDYTYHSQVSEINQGKIINFADKGKMSIITMLISSYQKNNNSKKLSFTNQVSLLIKGVGGSNYQGKNATILPQIPSREADLTISQGTFPGQAFIYRLSGDRNPLHIDPNTAILQRFQKPIFHGLGSFGVICKALVEKLLDGKPENMSSYHCRFVGHVFPGQILVIQVWKQNESFVIRAKTKERGKPVIIGKLTVKPKQKL